MALRKRRSQPAYLKIYARIAEQIQGGRLAAGAKLPSERELAGTHGVSLMTARHALAELERRGMVTRRIGSGTYVAPQGGGARRLLDPHAEFHAPVCRLAEGGLRQWCSGKTVVAEERIWLQQDGDQGRTPLLEFLGRAGLFAVEEIEPGRDALRIRQTIYGPGQELLAVREMIVAGRKLQHAIFP
jgi:DNA-binding transcriptional regulator YhcF (GntR family)